MSKLHSALFALFAAFLLATTGCSKTVEGETKAWKTNVASVDGLKAQYPGMKPALESRLSAATSIHDEAEALSGDAQIDKLAAANKALRAGFVGDLQGLAAKLSKLREQSVEVTSNAGDESTRAAAKLAAEDVKKTTERIEALLKSGATDEAGATAIMKTINADVATAQKTIKAALSGDKKKVEAAKADADAAAAVEVKAADWTCDHCDSANKHDATSCVSCGAPRPVAKK